MQSITLMILLMSQVAAPAAYDPCIGQLPEIVVTAPRYENEDDAWAGLMPEAVVTAPKFTEASDAVPQPEARYATYEATENIPVNAAYHRTTAPMRDDGLVLPSVPGMLYGETAEQFKLKLAGFTVNGNYHIVEGDTIDDEVTVTGGNATIDGVIRDDLVVMGGMVFINGQVDGDVVVFGGNLDIVGTIRGDAAVFGGNITNGGTIEGDLAVIGGTVMLDSASVVAGDVNLVGGTVERHEYAEVLGEIESIEIEPLERLLPRVGRVFRFPHAFPGRFGIFPRLFLISALIVVFLLDLLVLVIFPGTVDQIAAKLQRNVWASVGCGVGIEVLYIPLILLFAISIIGIPLIPVFGLAVLIATRFGAAALALVIADRVCSAFKWNISNRVALFALGWATVMIIPFIAFLIGKPLSILGWIIVYVATTIGIGAVIWALIKKENKTSTETKPVKK
jgi:hypothetical protein